MRDKLTVDFQTDDAEMERIWEKHISPQFEGDEFNQRQVVEDLWNDETINDNELVVSLMKVGGIGESFKSRNNPSVMSAQLLGGL